MRQGCRSQLQLYALAIACCVPAACVTVETGAPEPSPVTVSGAKGAVTQSSGDATVARAVADAPDPEAIKRLESLMETISDEPLFKDNEVKLLVDGPETYAAMLTAIAAAKKNVNLETYIFNEDEVGRRFSDALLAKSAEGVEVRVIYDAMGSRESSPEFFDRMKEGGIHLVEFHPVNPATGGNPLDLNVRDHRKLLITDGYVAFAGGINLDKSYSSSSVLRRRPQGPGPGWRDTHIQIRGPAVAGIQRLFLVNWKEGGGPAPEDEASLFPKPVASGKSLVRVLSSVGGDEKVSPIRVAYGFAMEAASERIWITQSYFAPDPEFLQLMTSAAARGVDVRIIVTGISDSALLLHISRSCYGELLRAGVRIYESAEILLHAKTAVIDGVWSTVGSSNLDYRSFVHNDEVNAVVVGADFGTSMESLFLKDMAISKPILLEEWEDRPLLDKIKEKFSRLVQYWLYRCPGTLPGRIPYCGAGGTMTTVLPAWPCSPVSPVAPVLPAVPASPCAPV